MPTRKKSAQSKKAVVKSGAVPPHGIAIRQALARGDSREMWNVAVSARKYLSRVQSALDGLEKALARNRS